MVDLPIAVVTGASGIVGSEITKQLLEGGYTVRATSRDVSRNEHLDLLGKLLPGKLEQWAVENIQEEGSFDQAVQGATYVFHCAAVVGYGTGNEEVDKRDMVDPAVNGDFPREIGQAIHYSTVSILKSVAKAKTVKRVVYCSSAGAIRCWGDDPTAQTYTEKDWSDSATMAVPYFVSKREAEKVAWKLAEEHGIDLVSIIPSSVIGPTINPKPTLNSITIQMVLGGMPILQAIPIDVHIDNRDTAKAHILAAENPNAKGRYIVSHDHITNRREVAQILREAYPDFPIQDCPDEPTVQIFDTSKLKELGMTDLIPVRKSILDQARSVFAKGLLSSA